MADDLGRERSTDPLPRCADDKLVLRYGKAFVVHFAAEIDARLEHAVGRVERLPTGRRSRFASIEDLLACMRAGLADTDRPAERREPDA